MEQPAEARSWCGGSSPAWVGASGQKQFTVFLPHPSSSYVVLSDPCWQLLNNFKAWAVSAQSRALGGTNGGACSAYIVACGEISPNIPNSETPGLFWLFRSSALLTFRFRIHL